MRLVRLVVAGIVLGAVGGYAAALLRPRSVHRGTAAGTSAQDPAPLPEHVEGEPLPELAVPAEVHP